MKRWDDSKKKNKKNEIIKTQWRVSLYFPRQKSGLLTSLLLWTQLSSSRVVRLRKARLLLRKMPRFRPCHNCNFDVIYVLLIKNLNSSLVFCFLKNSNSDKQFRNLIWENWITNVYLC